MEATVPILLLAVAFYLLVARPMMTRSRRAQEIKTHLKPGVKIITTSGFLGTVQRVEEDEITLELGPGVTVTMLAGAVGKILDPEARDPDAEKPTGEAGGTGDKAKDTGGKGSDPASPTSD